MWWGLIVGGYGIPILCDNVACNATPDLTVKAGSNAPINVKPGGW